MVVEAFKHVLLLLGFRSMPFAVYGIGTRTAPFGVRAGIAAAYVALCAVLIALGQGPALGASVLGSAYYFVVGWAVPRCADALAQNRVTKGSLFVAFAAVYLLVPAIAFPEKERLMFIVLGWDLLMASYSYAVDVSTMRSKPSRAECLFFLFVNPTVTYSNRGQRVGGLAFDGRGAARVALGACSMFVSLAFAQPVYRLLAQTGESRRLSVAIVGLAYGAARFFSEYASHSGLASMQIGLARQVGLRVPERYHFPFLADSPLDFFRRWNTYVTGWLGKYVFVPAARQLHKRIGPASKMAALFVTFIASGLLHDGFTYASRLVVSTRGIELFAVVAMSTLIWLGAASLVRRVIAIGASARGPMSLLARLGTLTVVFCITAGWR